MNTAESAKAYSHDNNAAASCAIGSCMAPIVARAMVKFDLPVLGTCLVFAPFCAEHFVALVTNDYLPKKEETPNVECPCQV